MATGNLFPPDPPNEPFATPAEDWVGGRLPNRDRAAGGSPDWAALGGGPLDGETVERLLGGGVGPDGELAERLFGGQVGLDGEAVERLLGGGVRPEDAPSGYAEVARLLGSAAGPPCPDELAGAPAALATFRTVRHRARVRSHLVTVALAGTLLMGLWIADGAPSPFELLSPSGDPGTGGSGSGVPAAGPGPGGAGSGGAGPGGAGSALRAASPPVVAGTAAGPGTGGESQAAAGAGGGGSVAGRGSAMLPSTRERAIARHRGGGASRAGGSANGVRPAKPAKSQAAKPPKPPKAKPGKAGKGGGPGAAANGGGPGAAGKGGGPGAAANGGGPRASANGGWPGAAGNGG